MQIVRAKIARKGVAMGLATVPAELTEKIDLVPGELCVLRFKPLEGPMAQWAPGDYFYIVIPTKQDGVKSTYTTDWPKQAVRAYSLSNVGKGGYYEAVIVKKHEGGYVSNLVQGAKAGDTLQVSSHKWFRTGKLTLKDPADWNKKLFFFGGGTAIAPFLAMARYMKDKKLNPNVALLASFRSEQWAIFPDELRELPEYCKNAKTFLTLTREKEVPGFLSGRFVITEKDESKKITAIKHNLFPELVPDISERFAYICGSDAMADDAEFALLASGVPKEHIKIEKWG